MSHVPLRIGTSGWSYPAGTGTWNGLFYPLRPDPGSRKRFDELAYYSQFFDTVEVNATFYRQPSAATTRRWVERTPAGFEFSVKLYQRLTHSMPVGHEAGARTSTASNWSAPPPLPAGTAADADEFRTGIAPLAEGGKLGAILVQFPPSFRASPQTIDYLRWLLGQLHGHQVAVELRHRSWSDRALDTQAILAEFGAAWTQIDEPKFRFSIRQDFRANVPGCYYLRLHGRNAKDWWRPENPEDRYNYLYSAAELAPLAEAAEAARAGVGKAYVYFNNHFSAKAVVNAAVLKQMLNQPISAGFETELVAAYPELRGIVRERPSGESGRLPWDTDR
jgi:uncharacterized protein YecE (DUF72 family)